MTNTNNPYENTNEPKKDSVMDSLREPLESLKTAGASAAGVAKEFSQRLREDREVSKAEAAGFASATQATGAETKGDASILDKVTAVAKDLGGSVKRAAEATAQTPQYAEAKERIGEAAKTTKVGVTEAYGTAKANREAKKASKGGAATGTATGTAGATGSETPGKTDIIDGEVISTED